MLRPRGTLARILDDRANGLGALRLLLAATVVVSHVFPLGWGRPDPLWLWSGRQTDLGKAAVLGFFALSGFVITESARRLPPGRYLWHRALRIGPGLGGSLLFSAAVLMPALYWWQHGTLGGFWTRPDGPLSYLTSLGSAAPTTGWDVSGVIAEGVRSGTNFDRSLNGALWSLKYELLCYLAAGLLAALGLLRRRAFVASAALALWLLVASGAVDLPAEVPPAGGPGVALPLLGLVTFHLAATLGLAFLLGGVLRLYAERIPLHDALALTAALVLTGSARWGGFAVLGVPALVYLLFWAASALPRRWRAIGVRGDYSYGVYVFGFPVEQALALTGAARFGPLGFLAGALAVTGLLAALSWHLVEAPALRLRSWTPGQRRRAAGRGPRPPAPPRQPRTPSQPPPKPPGVTSP
ncbi:acyltransferase family protein [Kitasatospora sp. NPDC005751]|uniref:acyltransferase family protein n=1 Tax=Kitasatospora sp. NPDC005751 TaxID=3157064 RepID=UPI0033E05497